MWEVFASMGKILVKNGRIWDGERFFYGDVLTDGGVIAKIGENIHEKAAYTYDASGKIVSAGLVDCHVHMKHISSHAYGIRAEMCCLPFGVTAANDAGGIHGDENLLSSFGIKTTVFAGAKIRENAFDAESTEKFLAAYGKKALGVKVFFDTDSKHITDITPLRQVCDFAKERNLKVMVHCNGSPAPMMNIIETLSPGDILTHVYHGGENTCRENDFACLKLAREKGVVLDAGFAGHVHTDFAVLQAAVAAGYTPDTISTDITCFSAYKRGGRYGMTACMSMAKTAGMAETDIFRAVTSNPAKALGMDWGYLKEGGCADIAVFDIADEGFSFKDKAGNVLQSETGYRCKLTISDGEVVYRD